MGNEGTLKMDIIDKFQCVKCNFVWEQKPKLLMQYDGARALGYTRSAEPCPNCGSLYCKWLTWEG